MRKINYKKISSEFKTLVQPSSGNNRSSLGDKKIGEYFYIKVDDLVPFKQQARTKFDEEEIRSLAESIKSHGVRQPLTIIPSPDLKEKYEVVSGERRLRASKIAGLIKVPCTMIHDYNKAEEIALVENIHREDLHPIELANALEKLLENKIFESQADISNKLSITKTTVSELIQLSKLDSEVKKHLIAKDITNREKLRKLSKLIGKSDLQKELLGIITSSKVDRANPNFSVLRVKMENGELKVQNSGIKKLSKEEKIGFKKVVAEILEEV